MAQNLSLSVGYSGFNSQYHKFKPPTQNHKITCDIQCIPGVSDEAASLESVTLNAVTECTSVSVVTHYEPSMAYLYIYLSLRHGWNAYLHFTEESYALSSWETCFWPSASQQRAGNWSGSFRIVCALHLHFSLCLAAHDGKAACPAACIVSPSVLMSARFLELPCFHLLCSSSLFDSLPRRRCSLLDSGWGTPFTRACLEYWIK